MKNNHFKILAFIMATVMLLNSCASIVSKSTYPLTINSNPSNCKVVINDKSGKEIFQGNTPSNIKLKAGDGFFSRAEYTVRISHPGYDDKIIPVTFSLDGWYWGNILIGGVLGMLIIDPATGAMWKIENEFINETLNKTSAFNDSNLKIIDINTLSEDARKHLVRIK